MNKLISTVLLVGMIALFGNSDLSSKTYKKKSYQVHNLGIGVGLQNITAESWDRYSSGINLSAGYTYTKRALMYSGNITYTSFSETDSEELGFKANLQDISVNAGIYWNILQQNFYEGITPYIGAETGYTLFNQEIESNDGNASASERYFMLNIGPVIGLAIPISDNIALITEARYKITWVNVGTGGGFGNTGSVSILTDYNYSLISAGLRLGI